MAIKIELDGDIDFVLGLFIFYCEARRGEALAQSTSPLLADSAEAAILFEENKSDLSKKLHYLGVTLNAKIFIDVKDLRTELAKV